MSDEQQQVVEKRREDDRDDTQHWEQQHDSDSADCVHSDCIGYEILLMNRLSLIVHTYTRALKLSFQELLRGTRLIFVYDVMMKRFLRHSSYIGMHEVSKKIKKSDLSCVYIDNYSNKKWMHYESTLLELY